MTEQDSPITDAALAALAAERAAQAAAEQARDKALADEAKALILGFLPKVDPAKLAARTWPDAQVVTVTDGAVTLTVDREKKVRLADVVDGQPTSLSEPLPSLAALGELLEGRA